MEQATSVSKSASGLHAYALALAICALLLVISGGALTTSNAAAAFELPHQILAGIVGALAIGLIAWLLATPQSPALRRLGWMALAALAVEAALGLPGALQSMPVTTRVIHACLAQVFLIATIAVWVCTSKSWNESPLLAADSGWPSLRSLAVITPVMVLIQILLGACFRHKALGMMPHIAFAMIVAIFILMVCIFVTQQFPEHKTLRPAANALLAFAGAQVFLGIAAITVLMLTTDPTPVAIATTSAHVGTGGLTFAASVVLGMQIRRNVYKRPEEEEESNTTVVTE